MPARILARLALISGLVLLTSGAAPVPVPVWLVQVSFPMIPKHPDADADAYPGRVEVYGNGRFIGCAWASYYEPAPGQRRLVPLNVGYTVRGDRDDIRVEAFGELDRLGGMTVRISELNGPAPTQPGAR